MTEATTITPSTRSDVWTPGRAPASIWILTAAMVLLCAVWSLLTPQFLAPDESAHFATTVRVSEGFSWPDPTTARFPAAVEAAQAEARTPHSERSTLADLAAAHPGPGERVDQMTQHPPLYYLLTGAIMGAPGVKDLVWDQSMLAVRLLGALLAAPLVWLSWNGVATLLRSRRMGLVAAAATFVVPQLPQTLGVTTNDSLAILMAWVVTWLAVKVMCGDRRLLTVIALGVAFGVGCLVKGTVLPLGALLVLAPLFGDRLPSRWLRRFADVGIALGTALIVGGWWWIRNLVLFRTLQPNGMVEEPGTWPPGTGPSIGHYIDEFWRTTPTTFWGWFGRVNVPLPNLLVDVLTVTCLLLVVVGLARRGPRLVHSVILLVPVVLSALLFVRTSWLAYTEMTEVRGLHGRYFFTVLLALIALAAIAAANVVRAQNSRVALAVAVHVAAAMLTLGGLGVAFLGFYADNEYGRWRDGLATWLGQYSPIPSAAVVVVLIALVITLAGGLVWGARSAVRRGVERSGDLGLVDPTV